MKGTRRQVVERIKCFIFYSLKTINIGRRYHQYLWARLQLKEWLGIWIVLGVTGIAEITDLLLL
jgi:hypothetical protein